MSRKASLSNMKGIMKAFLLLFVLSLQGEFVDDVIAPAVKYDFKPVLSVDTDYLKHSNMEKVSFETKRCEVCPDSLERKGVFFSRKNAPATVLICHGYMCDKDDISFIRTVFDKYNCMTFDFRAHGEASENQQCTFGKEEAFDVIGAVDYLRSRPEVAGKPIIVYGFSMGAVSAIEAQARKPMFDGMILDCPFDSSENLIKKGLSNLKLNVFGYEFRLPGQGLLQKYAYSSYVQGMLKTVLKTISKFDASEINTKIMPVAPVESVEKIDVPCYFITCKNDEKVSVDAVTSVYAGAKGYKRLWITNGRRHFDSFFYNPEKYIYEVNQFVHKLIKGQLKNDDSAKIFADPEMQNS